MVGSATMPSHLLTSHQEKKRRSVILMRVCGPTHEYCEVEVVVFGETVWFVWMGRPRPVQWRASAISLPPTSDAPKTEYGKKRSSGFWQAIVHRRRR